MRSSIRAFDLIDMPQSFTALVWRRFRGHKPALIGLGVLAIIVALCVVVPWLAAYDPGKIDLNSIRQAPSLQHIFGTDELGRDLFVRLCDGGRVSLVIGIATMIISIFLGTLVGAVAGFYGGGAPGADAFAGSHAAVLNIVGEQDTHVLKSIRALDQGLNRYAMPHELVVYPGGQHAFFNDTRKEVYNAAAAQDAWKRTLDWFHKYLAA